MNSVTTAVDEAGAVVTEEYIDRWGNAAVRAMSTDQDALETWLADYFHRYHPAGYSTWSDGILETAQGFVVTVRRRNSCE